MRKFNNGGEKDKLAGLKSNKPYKLSVIKRTITKATAIVLSLTAIAGMVFGFAGCVNTQDPSKEDPGIVVPNPDQGIEDPGKEDPGKEDPDPGTDPGKEDPDPSDPGKEDPDPGTDPGTDPSEPGTDPSEPSKEEPTIDDIDTIDELFMEEPFYPDFDSEEEYNEAKALYDLSQEAQGIVLTTLNDNVYEKMLSKNIRNYNIENIEDAKWEMNTAEDGKTIESIRLFFFNHPSETSRTYYVSTVVPKTTLTLDNLLNPSSYDFEEAFNTNMYFGARYTTDYAFSYDPSEQERRGELKDAINAKLAEDGVINALNDGDITFIRDDGSNTDSGLQGTARKIVVLKLTSHGYEEYAVRIKENQSNNNDQTLIENLNAGNYYDISAEAKEGEFSNNIIENDVLQQTMQNTTMSYNVIYKDPDTKEEYVLKI